MYAGSEATADVLSNRPLDPAGRLVDVRTPLLSFIVLSYNNAAYLAATLRSVAEQTVEDFEILIVDDASADDSWSLITRFAGDQHRPILAARRHSNGGVARAYNEVLRRARGEYIAHIGSDDINRPERLQTQLQALQRSGKSMCIAGMDVIDEDGRRLRSAVPRIEQQALAHLLSGGEAAVTSPTMCYHRSLVDRFGLLPESLANEDEALAVRALALGGIEVVAEPLVSYRVHPNSITSRARTTSLRAYVAWRVSNLPFQVANKRHWQEIARAVGHDALRVHAQERVRRLEHELAQLTGLPPRLGLSGLLKMAKAPALRAVLMQFGTQRLRMARLAILRWRARTLEAVGRTA